ncbi:MAG: nucleotidyltransferase substrate binding protein [Spirochaetia bacterium]|nr:nucleotidyltransferase substrate binding protein [Spirochaetia bacterium]
MQTAFRKGWISEEEAYLELLHSRNLTSHTYNHEIAVSVYHTIKKYLYVFDDLYKVLNNLTNEIRGENDIRK